MDCNLSKLTRKCKLSTALIRAGWEVFIKPGKAILETDFVSQFLRNDHTCCQAIAQEKNEEQNS